MVEPPKILRSITLEFPSWSFWKRSLCFMACQAQQLNDADEFLGPWMRHAMPVRSRLPLLSLPLCSRHSWPRTSQRRHKSQVSTRENTRHESFRVENVNHFNHFSRHSDVVNCWAMSSLLLSSWTQGPKLQIDPFWGCDPPVQALKKHVWASSSFATN